MPWLLDEDDALKKALDGVLVNDRTDAARKVPVYFGLPDIELRQQSYPYITIDLLDIAEARERVHRGRIELNYVPEGYATPQEAPVYDAQGKLVSLATTLMEEWPTPYDLTYQITSWARHPRHDRQILSQLLGKRIPVRSGQVVVAGDTTRNSTVRRLDMLGVAKRDTLDGDRKRLFRNVFTVRMSSELFPAVAAALVSRVLSVEVTGPTVTSPEYKQFLSVTRTGP